MKARHQCGTRFERPCNPSPDPSADRVLEQADGGAHVGDPVGSSPQERNPSGYRSVERREPSGDHAPVGHRVLAVHGELVWIAAADGLGHGLGGGAMAGARIGEKKDEALRAGHHRKPTR